MLFSIITPVRESDQRYLKVLEHTLNVQRTRNFEWIIVTPSEIKINHARFPVHIFVHSYQRPGDAYNRAVREATGDYLLFADADDYLRPDALASLTQVVEQNPGSVEFDLKSYLTYEPYRDFVKRKPLPRFVDYPYWGEAKSRRPHPAKLSYLPSPRWKHFGTTAGLANGYHVYSGRRRYLKLWTQLRVAGKVVPRSIVLAHHIRFDPGSRFHPAFTFCLGVMQHTSVYLRMREYLYVKVKHFDMVNRPSLTQTPSKMRWLDFIASSLHGWLDIKDRALKTTFSRRTVNYINRYFPRALVDGLPTVQGERKTTLRALGVYFRYLPDRAFKRLNGLGLDTVIALKRQEYPKAFRYFKDIIFFRLLEQVILKHGLYNRKVAEFAYRYFFSDWPVRRNVVIFESFLGRYFSDSPKYIYLYLYRHERKHLYFVWIADPQSYRKIKRQLRGFVHTKVVRRYGVAYAKYLATAKYAVFNMRQPKWYVHRPGTKFLQTWHGTPLKRLTFDVAYQGPSYTQKYKRNFYLEQRQWDGLIAQNNYSASVFRHAFLYTGPYLNTGYPRNDILSSANKSKVARKIKERLGIPLDKKVILYAPTWRDDQAISSGRYRFKLHLNLKQMRKRFGRKCVLLLRTHYLVTQHLSLGKYKGFVYNVSDYDDITELYLASDVLITDYSSVFFDYAILRRPILFFVYDYDTYAHQLHGFYLSMKRDLPGPLLKTNRQLFRALADLPAIERKYRKRYAEFSARFNAWDDGNASQRCARWLLDDV